MELNNRELAVIFWMFLLVLYITYNSKMHDVRASLRGVLRTLMSKPLLITHALIISYVLILVIWLFQLGLWDWSQSKNTIIWLVSVGWLSLFNLDKYRKNQHFYKEFCFSNFKLLAIVQFILGIYTFSIWVELILVPVLALFGMLHAFSQTDKKFLQAEKLITNIFAFYGLGLISYTLYMAIKDFNSLANEATAYDFLIPSILTILYLPFVYLMLLYSTYERVFIRLRFSIKEHKLLKYAKFYAFIRFHFRLNLLDRWVKSLVYVTIQTNADINRSVDEFFSRLRIEKNPPAIKTNKGWSPFDAMYFLKEEGIVAEDYHPTFSNEWVARSEYVKTSQDRDISNSVIYRVNGNATIADSLELDFSMSSVDSLKAGHDQLLFYAKALINKALDREAPEDVVQAIMEGISSVFKIGIYEVELKKNEWGNKSLRGYDFEFYIRLSKDSNVT